MTRKLSIFTRIGGKYNVREKIVKFFPKEYKTYIEPFLGGGQVFLELKKDPNVEYILNDANVDIYNIWKDLQKIDPEIIRKYNWKGSEKQFNDLLNSNPKTPELRLYRNLYLSYYSFSGTRKSYVEKNVNRGGTFLKNIEILQEKLKGVKIFNDDYEKIIKEYDNPNAVIYLDPPYTEKEQLYEGQGIDPFELAKVCKSIKGKFILSYDISPKVKEAFKDFYFYKIKVPYVASFKNFNKYEYIITNFPKTIGGRIQSSLYLCDEDERVEPYFQRGIGLINLERFLRM